MINLSNTAKVITIAVLSTVIVLLSLALGYSRYSLSSVNKELTEQKEKYSSLQTKYNTSLDDLGKAEEANDRWYDANRKNEEAIRKLQEEKTLLDHILSLEEKKNEEYQSLIQDKQLQIDNAKIAKTCDGAMEWVLEQNNEIADSWNRSVPGSLRK